MANGVVNLFFRMFKQGSGLQDTIDDTKKLLGNTNDLSQGMKKLGTAFGTTGGLLGSLVGNLAKGSIWQFAGEGVKILIDKWKEYRERAAEAAKAAAKAMRDSMTAAAESVTESFRKIFSSYAKERKAIAAELASSNSAASNSAAGARADVDIRASLDSIGVSDSEKRVIAANAAYEKGMLSAAESVKKAENANAAAQKSLETATIERIRAEEALEAAERAEAEYRAKFGKPAADRELYQKLIADAEQSYWKGLISLSYRNEVQAQYREKIAFIEENHKDVLEQMAKNTKAVADARAKLAEAAEAAVVADKACEATESALAVAEKQRTATELQLDAASKAAKAAQEAEAKSTEAAVKKAEREAAIEEHGREMLANARTESERAVVKADIALAKARLDAEAIEDKHSAEAVKAASAVSAAEFALAEAKRKAAEEAERSALAEEKLRKQDRQLQQLDESIFRLKRRYADALRGIDRTRRGQGADADHTNGLFGPYQYGGRSNGGENFIDWDRANRFAGWGDRDAQKAARRDAAAQKRYDRIRDALENGETVSKADEAFFGKFKAYQDQKGGAEKLKNELEAAQKKRDQLQEEMKKTLESIDKNIKDALAVG